MHDGSMGQASFWRRMVMASILAGMSVIGMTGSALGHAEHGHPARIHEGSCDDLGRVSFRLNGVGGSVDLDNVPIDAPMEVNPDRAYQVLLSNTLIDGTIDDLLAGDFAVMVYESDDDMSAISCGNIGGAMDGDMLATGLAEMGIPGHLGFAVFSPAGEQTAVEVMLGHALAPMSAMGNGAMDDAEGGHANGDMEDHDEAGEESHDDAATPVP